MSLQKIKIALASLKRLPWLAYDLQSLSKLVTKLNGRLEDVQEALGRIELRQLSVDQSTELVAKEFRVFSQWGEDGIIQFLISRIPIENKTFIEFGVEDYTQANTRFLLVNNNWRGLVIDSDKDAIARLGESAVCWQGGLKVVSESVTAENINELLSSNGFTGEVGLLSIDIDGNDYWVWRAITVINPAIVIVEYNHRFGAEAAVTIPYDKDFARGKGHPIFYFGASLKALCQLAARKGYAFVGCNSNGVNAFFVRRDKLPADIRELTPAEGYVAGRFSEARDEQQRFIIYQPDEERLLLMNQPLVNVEDEN